MSAFGDQFSVAGGPVDLLVNQLGDAVKYQKRGTGVQTDETLIFNELVGALDDFGNAVFTGATIGDNAISGVDRGDFITTNFGLASEIEWRVVDVRDDLAGGFEVRGITAQEVN